MMVATSQRIHEVQTSRRVHPAGFGFLIAIATLVIIAHGCHGPDEDHEPGLIPGERRDMMATASEGHT